MSISSLVKISTCPTNIISRGTLFQANETKAELLAEKFSCIWFNLDTSVVVATPDREVIIVLSGKATVEEVESKITSLVVALTNFTGEFK